MVYSLRIPGTGSLNSRGITNESYAHLVDVPPNNFEALEKAFEDNKDKGGVAGIMVEPIGGESGAHPVHRTGTAASASCATSMGRFLFLTKW